MELTTKQKIEQLGNKPNSDITMRQHLAGIAMQAIINSTYGKNIANDFKTVSEESVMFADNLLEQLTIKYL
jgi:hypothetical protein